MRIAQLRTHRGAFAALVLGVALLAASAAGWLFWPQTRTEHGASAPALPIQADSPVFRIETATEQQILDHVPSSLTIFRFSDNAQILVLAFASLREQGEMLNRV